MGECQGKYIDEICKKCEYTFSYMPKDGNGVLFVFREPGGSRKECETTEDFIKGNEKWFSRCVDSCDKENCEKADECHLKANTLNSYKNRFLDLLKAVGFQHPEEELLRCCYANICYGRKAKKTDSKEGYASLSCDVVKKRFELIRNTFLSVHKGRTDLKKLHIFLIYDAFLKIYDDGEDGLIYKENKKEYRYKMKTEKTEDGMSYSIYAVRHPITCPSNVELRK